MMTTDLQRHAVGLAIKKCMGHPRFPEALSNPRTRTKIFGLIARLANEELGRTAPAASHRPSDQMDDLIRTPPERQRAAMQELVDLALGTNRTGGGL